MTEIEDKTGLVKRYLKRVPHVEAIEAAVSEIQQMNRRLFEDDRLAVLCADIEKEAAALKE